MCASHTNQATHQTASCTPGSWGTWAGHWQYTNDTNQATHQTASCTPGSWSTWAGHWQYTNDTNQATHQTASCTPGSWGTWAGHWQYTNNTNQATHQTASCTPGRWGTCIGCWGSSGAAPTRGTFRRIPRPLWRSWGRERSTWCRVGDTGRCSSGWGQGRWSWWGGWGSSRGSSSRFAISSRSPFSAHPDTEFVRHVLSQVGDQRLMCDLNFIHARSCDCNMYGKLLWEQADLEVTVQRLIVWVSNLADSHLTLTRMLGVISALKASNNNNNKTHLT